MSAMEGKVVEGTGATLEDTLGAMVEGEGREVGATLGNTKVQPRDLGEYVEEPVDCALCGHTTSHIIRGGGGFVACAGDCQKAPAQG